MNWFYFALSCLVVLLLCFGAQLAEKAKRRNELIRAERDRQKRDVAEFWAREDPSKIPKESLTKLDIAL